MTQQVSICSWYFTTPRQRTQQCSCMSSWFISAA